MHKIIWKWESGESIPDVYKITQLANIFDVSIEKLVWGGDKDKSAEQMAKIIYSLFVENMESLRATVLADKHSSSIELATKLRAEIKKARVVFPRKVIDELMDLTEDFGIYREYVLNKEEYKEVLQDPSIFGRIKNERYCKVILKDRYDRIETLLKVYIEFPE